MAKNSLADLYKQGTGQTADAATLAELERQVQAAGGVDPYIAANFQNWTPDVQANLAAPYMDQAGSMFRDVTGRTGSQAEIDSAARAMAQYGGAYPAIGALWDKFNPIQQGQLLDWQMSQDAQRRAGQVTGTEQVNALRGDFMGELEDIIGPQYQRPGFNFEADPGYQFRLAEGQKALERGQLARGDFFSGQAMKELGDYTQGMASNEFDRSFNRYLAGVDRDYAANQARTGQRLGAWGQAFGNAAGLENQGWGRAWGMDERDYMRGWNENQRDWDRFSQLSTSGQNAAGQTGAAGQAYGANAGNAYMRAGDATAGGYINAANAWTNAGQNALTSYYNSKRPVINYGGYGGGY